MRPDANTTWFNFTAESGNFGVYAFQGIEEVNEPYQFIIELVSRSANEEIDSLLRRPALLSIKDRSGEERLVHGIIRQMEQLHTGNAFTHYRVVLVPRLWYLGKIIDHRIFQNLSVVEIIQQMLKEQGFADGESSFKLSKNYEAREYCVQYGETDLHFITRLCEEEGIFFYFEHKENSHCLCFCDAEGGPKIAGESDLRFYEGSGHSASTSTISRLRLQHTVNSNAATYKEWNFTKPKLDLTSSRKEPGQEKAPVPTGMLLEQYRYPHLYGLQAQGARYAALQLSRQLTFTRWIECESDVARFLPSYTFTIHGHQRDDINTGWWIVSAHHHGEQPGVLEHEAPDGRGFHYSSYVKAIPAATRFVPELVHPKNRVTGSQTAIVTGPEGEEIFTDKFGRVKVQFFWDREGEWDDTTTCWIRVSQGWAGSHYGSIAIPRIGHEVVVSFLEGDPDRPLITGRVYHALNMPPYSLPEHKTRTTIKSKTQHGDGFNELRFEDLQGMEQVFLHAQQDIDIIALNDRREWIKGERHLTVEKDKIEHVKGSTSNQTDGDRIEATAKKRTVTVGGDEAHQVAGSFHQKVENKIYIEGMSSGVIEMHEDVTIKAPGGFIRIDKQGITIMGKVVNINSGGSAGTGFPVQAGPARAAMLADSRNASSGSASATKGAQQAPQIVAKNPADASADATNTFGNQSFTSSPIDTGALANIAAPSAAMAATAFTSLQKGPQAAELLKLSDTPNALEWRKTVKAAQQQNTVAGKIDTVNSYFSKNVKQVNGSLAEPGPLNKTVLSGQGSELETAVAKYQTLSESGVPPEAMNVVVTQDSAFLAVRDNGQTLVAEANTIPGAPCKNASALPQSSNPAYGVSSGGIVAYAPVNPGV